MTRTERHTRRVAKAIGEDPGRIASVKAVLVDRLMRSGVIVDLDIGRWRGLKRLRKQDLGLSDEAFEDVRHLIEYGHKRLLPLSYLRKLNSLEVQARTNLERHGFRTAFGAFVPERAYAAWKTKHLELQGSYFAVRDEMASRYRQIRTEVLAEYEKAAADAWQVGHNGGRGRAAFVEDYLARIREAFPPLDVVTASFRFDFTLRTIPLTSAVMKEMHSQAKVESEGRMAEEIRRHYADRKTQLIDRYLADVVGQLRSLVFDVCDDVLASIKKNGTLVSRSAVQLRGLVERVGQLNFYGDQAIDRKLRDVLQTLEAPVRKGNDDARGARIEALMLDLRETCRAAKEGLEHVDPLALALEINDSVEVR